MIGFKIKLKQDVPRITRSRVISTYYALCRLKRVEGVVAVCSECSRPFDLEKIPDGVNLVCLTCERPLFGELDPCTTCGGERSVACKLCAGNGWIIAPGVVCNVCDGTGKRVCPDCVIEKVGSS